VQNATSIHPSSWPVMVTRISHPAVCQPGETSRLCDMNPTATAMTVAAVNTTA
jgi:hypothetical protein